MFFLFLSLLSPLNSITRVDETTFSVKYRTTVGEPLEETFRTLQRYFSIDAVDRLDEDIIPTTEPPSSKDEDFHYHHRSRLKRFSLNHGKWKQTNLSYRILSYPPDVPEEDVRKEFQRAYTVWSSISDFTFTYKGRDSAADLTIEFPAQKRHRNCHRDFDGKGNILAHTFPPMMLGAMHFDPAENWTVNSTTGTDIFSVAVHEIGHSLGLSHSTHAESLMAPVQKRKEEYYHPSADDIEGIQELYGPRARVRRPTLPTDMHALCANFTYDTIFTDKNGSTVYVLSGPNYWAFEGGNVKPGYPRKISEDWLGLPGDLHAAFTTARGQSYFFKGKKYWRYNGFRMAGGFPRDLRRGFPGAPNSMDAVYQTVDEGAIYFFKGNSSWKFVRGKNHYAEVKLINATWRNLPYDLTAALPASEGYTYFFKGDLYYKFKEDDGSVESAASADYPKSMRYWWFKCKNAHNGTAGEFLNSM